MILINPGFSKSIIAKYSVLVHRHRRCPALIFLAIKPLPNFQFLSLLMKNRTTLAPYYNYNYHLNPKLIFNINLLARLAAEKSPGTRERLFKPPGSGYNLNLAYSNLPGSGPVLNQAYSSITSTLTAAAYSYPKSLKILNIKKFLFPGSGIVSILSGINQERQQGNSRLISLTLQGSTSIIEKKSAAAVHHSNSIAVFNPALTAAIHHRTSGHINGSLSSSAESSSAEFFAVPGSTHSTSISRDSTPAVSAPGLNYNNSIGMVLEDMKKTVTRIEEQIKEEKKMLQKSFTRESSHPVYSNKSDTPINNTSLNQLTDQVYRMMEKKIRIERERRGW